MARSWFAVLVLSACSVLAAEQELRVFQFHFRPAREAATLIEPMLSPEGSLLLQPGLNAITVRDNPDVLKRVTGALASWDVAPQAYKVRVRVFLAFHGAEVGRTAAVDPGDRREDVPALRLHEVRGGGRGPGHRGRRQRRGSRGRRPLPPPVHWCEAFRQESDRVQLAQLQLARRDRSTENTEVLTPLLRATVSLLVKQPSVIVGARSENANKALFLVLSAEREGKH